MLKNGCSSRTLYGVTSSINDDGSITLDGTAEASFVMYFSIESGSVSSSSTPESLYYPVGKYILSGDESGKLTLQLYQWNTSDDYNLSYGPDVTIDGQYQYNCIRLYIKKSSVFNSETIYPMMRMAGVADNTYEPYKPSIEERLAALESILASQAVNSATQNLDEIPAEETI